MNDGQGHASGRTAERGSRSGFARATGPTPIAAASLVLMLAAILVCTLAARRQGQDIASLQLLARGLVTRAPVYDLAWLNAIYPARYGIGPPQGLFYPPTTGLVVLPLAFLPFALTKWLWLSVTLAAVTFGVRAVVRCLAPTMPAHRWLGLAAIVLLTAAVRWGITPLQSAPLVLGLLCFFLAAVLEGAWKSAYALTALVVALKFTLAFPLVGILVLHRRYAGVAVVMLGWIALNALGFAWLGGASAWQAYRMGAASLEAFGDINTPDPNDPLSVPRLDWTYLGYGLLRDLPRARALVAVFAASSLAWIGWRGFRVRRAPIDAGTTLAFLAPLTCLSLLVVYHHHYDASVLLCPVLAVALVLARSAGEPQADDGGPLGLAPMRRLVWSAAAATPMLVLMAIAPVAKLQACAQRVGVEGALAAVNMAFPLATTLMLLASMPLVAYTTGRALRPRPDLRR